MISFCDFPTEKLLELFAASFHCDVVDGLLPNLSENTEDIKREILKRMGEEPKQKK
jgi:hypothetical protein